MKLSNIKRFWIALILSIPMIIQMLAMPFHWMMPGYNWIAFITTTVIMLISAAPYWKSAWAAFKKHPLFDPLNEYLKERDYGYKRTPAVKVVPAELGYDSGKIGAAALFFK